MIFFSSCSTTFAGSLFVFTFRDFILYVALAFLFALIIAFKAKGNPRNQFWIGFILGLVLSPLASFIYLLILFTKKQKQD